MIKKLLSFSKNLFTKTAFVTFAFRSKCRVNKSTSCKKKHSRKNSGIDSKGQNFTKKTVIAAKAITFCIKPSTHYLSRSDIKIVET